MRRLATILLLAGITAAASLWWLHDGDLAAGMEPVLVQWDAEGLARNAGIEAPSARD